MSDHTAGGHPAVLRSDHASRRHDAGQLYVNAQDSFSYAELLGLGSYKKMAGKHSSKQGKRSTFCTLLVEGCLPQPPFTSASAVVVMRISGIRHHDGRRVHRSGDLLV